MDPITAGALISGGSAILGGLTGQSSNKKIARENANLQREFAQHGVRWRVEDAKAAGLHPLYALGVQLPQFTPSFQVDSMGPAIAQAGQEVGRAVQAQQTAVERTQQALGLKLLESQIGETDARRDYYIAEAARARQSGLQAQTFPMQTGGPVTVGELDASDAMRGQVEMQAPIMPTRSSDNSSVMSGTIPLWRRVEVQPGINMVVPGGLQGDTAEVLETLGESPILMWMSAMESEKQYPGFLRWWSDEYLPGLKSARGRLTDSLEEIKSYADKLRPPRARYRTGGAF